MKAGGNLAQSHQGKNPREGPSFEIPMLTQKNVLDHHVLMVPMQHHCKKYPSNFQVTSKHLKTMFSTQFFYSTIPIKVPFA